MDWGLRLEKSPGVVVLSYNLRDSSPLFHVKMINLSAGLGWGDFPSCCCLFDKISNTTLEEFHSIPGDTERIR